MSQSNNMSRAAVQKWKGANSWLSNALESFLESCSHLEAVCVLEDGNSINLMSQIDSTLDLLTRSQSLLSRMRNRTGSRIRRLPNEILAEIFLDAIFVPTNKERAIHPEMQSVIQTIYQRLHVLNRVCTAWRNIIVNCKTAWHVVPFIDSNRKFGPKHLATGISLRRATNGLHLAAIRHGWSLDDSKILAEHVHRFSTANIRVTSQAVLKSILGAFLESKQPTVLSELSICQIPVKQMNSNGSSYDPNCYIYSKQSSLQRLFGTTIEGLSVLRISGVSLHWDMSTFSSRLTELYIRGVHLGHTSELMACLRAASSAPELQNLSIVSIMCHSESWARPLTPYSAFAFLKLQSLRLAGLNFSMLELVLKSVAPGPHQLILLLKENSLPSSADTPEKLFEDLCKLLQQFPVDTLLLGRWDWGRHLDARGFQTLLGSMPRLKTLKLKNWDLKAVWDALTRPDNASFPCLEELHLNSTFSLCRNLDPIKPMVRSHSIRKMVVGMHVGEEKRSKTLGSDRECLLALIGVDVVEWLETAVPQIHFHVHSQLYNNSPPELEDDWWGLW